MPSPDDPPSPKQEYRSFLQGLFGEPEKKSTPDPLKHSIDYCDRLISEFERLAAEGSAIARLPDWVEQSGLPLTVESLQSVPRLQAALADCTAYTPGKWLLEQELQRRIRFRHEAAVTSASGPDLPTWEKNSGDVYDAAQDAHLAGLAFSGGGIRSATFCLGVLQALAARDALPLFDYLSSVSGGGYIHQWFASWIARQPEGTARLAAVQKQLKPLPQAGAPARWPSQVQWLRRYSSYLTPQRGAFSADTWTMISIWFRNTFLNQIILISFLAVCLLAVRLVAAPFHATMRADTGLPWMGVALLLLVGLYQLYGSWRLARALYSLRSKATPLNPPSAAMNDRQVVTYVVLPSLLSAYTLALQAGIDPRHRWFLGYYTALWGAQIFVLLTAFSLAGLWPQQEAGWARSRCRAAILACVTAGLLAAGAGSAAHWLSTSASSGDSRLQHSVNGTAAYLNGKLGSRTDLVKVYQRFESPAGKAADLEVSYTGTSTGVPPAVPITGPELFSIVAPLLLIGLQFLTVRLQVGVLGTAWAESRREWMARLGAWTAMASLTWFLLDSITWLGPALCGWLLTGSNRNRLWAALTLVLVHAATLYAGASGRSDGKPQPGAFLGYKPLDLLGIIGAPLCVVSLLIMMAAGLEGALFRLAIQLPAMSRTGHTLLLAVGLSALFAFFAWRVDINEFSIHGFYRNRLARCYLGATNMRRTPDPFTGFDEHAENSHSHVTNGLPVSDLLPVRFGGRAGYDGPFPIFCSTVNLTFGEDLAYQERKGASFAFTPLYSGYHVGWTAGGKVKPAHATTFNGYVPTREYAYGENGIALSSAAAISGAALNPNQGYSSQPALAFLMTLFNVRLGWWIPNPRKPAVWPCAAGKDTPAFGLCYLLGELFGRANDTTNYVCLCDGGKFENMGLYELVRRRCTFIVVCDAESDPDYRFEGIGGAISKCRTDFGAEITLDLTPLRRNAETGFSAAHFVEGEIRYPAPPGKHRHVEYTGRIFYIKSAVVGDEPGDILHHKLTHAAFPNDTTVNQWFTESQFESYRCLGQISGEQFLSALLTPAGGQAPLPPVPHAGWAEMVKWLKRH